MGTWIGAVRSLGEIDYREALQKLKVPTLILWGEQDEITGPRYQEQVKSAFQSAATSHGTKVIYKTYGESTHNTCTQEYGHNFHWTGHEAVAKDIYSFITSETVYGIKISGNSSPAVRMIKNQDAYIELK